MAYNREVEEELFKDIWSGTSAQTIFKEHEAWKKQWQEERDRIFEAGYPTKEHDRLLGWANNWWRVEWPAVLANVIRRNASQAIVVRAKTAR